MIAQTAAPPPPTTYRIDKIRTIFSGSFRARIHLPTLWDKADDYFFASFSMAYFVEVFRGELTAVNDVINIRYKQVNYRNDYQKDAWRGFA